MYLVVETSKKMIGNRYFPSVTNARTRNLKVNKAIKDWDFIELFDERGNRKWYLETGKALKRIVAEREDTYPDFHIEENIEDIILQDKYVIDDEERKRRAERARHAQKFSPICNEKTNEISKDVVNL